MSHLYRLVARLNPDIVGMVGVGIRSDIGRLADAEFHLAQAAAILNPE